MGRGSSKVGGEEKEFKFGNASGGKGKTVRDLPARINTMVSIKNKNPEEVLKAFRKVHALADKESAVTVDENGYVTQYVHGGKSSVAIQGRKGEMIYHNHPSGGAFSKADLVNTALEPSKGIVASGKGGDYIFTKTQKFKAEAFVKAVETAKLKGKDYDDAANKWLAANAKKYGYEYKYIKRRKGE